MFDETKKEAPEAEELDIDNLDTVNGGSLRNAFKTETQDINDSTKNKI